MRISIITPARRGTRHGNRITAERWARILRSLGHRVRVETEYSDRSADLLVALHARKSHKSVARSRREHPDRPIFVALTGTDVYQDLGRSAMARRSLQLADRLIALQPLAARQVPAHLRDKVRVIYQSYDARRGRNPSRNRQGPLHQPRDCQGAGLPSRDRGHDRNQNRARQKAAPSLRPLSTPLRPQLATKPPSLRPHTFDICVVGHLRAVKDPFRTALAARLLHPESRIRVLHFGAAMSQAMKQRAQREEKVNPRFRWFGDRPHGEVLKRLARSQLLVISSRLEGGANVLSEAIALGVPVLATRIPGTVGILGTKYPGYFEPGDTRMLGELMSRAETRPSFLEKLRTACRKVVRLVKPENEHRAWRELLSESWTERGSSA